MSHSRSKASDCGGASVISVTENGWVNSAVEVDAWCETEEMG